MNTNWYGEIMFISTGIVIPSEEAHKKRVTGGIFRISAIKPSMSRV